MATRGARTRKTAAEREAGLGSRIYGVLQAIPTGVLWIIVAIWTIPTFGLFVNSFRPRDNQISAGWWTALPEFFNGTATLQNYQDVLSSGPTGGLWLAVVNSFAIAIPATIIPIAIAAFAAYAFAWIEFRGRQWLFIATVSLLAIPLQTALIPLLRMYNTGARWSVPFLDKTVTLFPDLDLGGNLTAVWLTHTGFALPFAIFLLHNYISGLPKDVFESAFIDGADHFTIFWRLILPLSMPVLAAFAIFQFLWTWNDYLIALTFVGGAEDVAPMTVRLANLVGSRGQDWEVLTAGAFVTSLLPLIIFFSLQRYFVRGLLAGSVKG